ncbi:hypothetical protein MBLNU230_g3921t1 [Neophaeotheca triangularis]
MASSDSAEDTGRLQSEAALKRSKQPAWLSDYENLPLDELRASMQKHHEELLAAPIPALLAQHTTSTIDSSNTKTRNPTSTNPKTTKILQTANLLLQLYDRTNHAASANAPSTTSTSTSNSNPRAPTPTPTDLRTQFTKDKTRLAALLESGKNAVAARHDHHHSSSDVDSSHQSLGYSQQVREIWGVGGADEGGEAAPSNGLDEQGESVEADLERTERVVRRVARIVGERGAE